MKKRVWTADQKEKLILEAKQSGVRATLEAYKLSSSTFNEWVKRYKKEGLQGLGNRKRPGFAEVAKLQRDLFQSIEEVGRLKSLIELYEELIKKVPISKIPVSERRELVRNYNGKGFHLNLLFGICQITKRQYYLKVIK